MTSSSIDVVNLLISISYFSIPVQLLVPLYHYRRLATLPKSLILLCLLFALNFLACGVGHLLRALDSEDENWNIFTCVVSLSTALYLVYLVPTWVRRMDSFPSIQDLVKLNEETAASKRKLFTFMNFLCHEIRNPLFAITSNIEFAQDSPMLPDVHESLLAINQSASLMLRLVNDVLDLSKIESGRLELEKQEFDLQDFFQNMASSMSRQVLAKSDGNVKFVFHMDPDVPRSVQSDSVRLLQICYNILSNASKFTERGAITFTVDVHEPSVIIDDLKNSSSNHDLAISENSIANAGAGTSGQSLNGMASLDHFSFSVFSNKKKEPEPLQSTSSVGGFLRRKESQKNVSESMQLQESDHETVMVRLSFEDTGIGIEEAHLERIFQPYTQSKLSDFRTHGGTGLGLSIIHKLLGMMEGTVNVTSKVGEGTKFVIHMPIVVLPPGTEHPEGDIENAMPADPLMDGSNASNKRGSYAKIDETDLYDLSEEDADYITPMSSASSLGPTIRKFSGQARKGGAVENGAVNVGMLPPERDDAATPQIQNKSMIDQPAQGEGMEVQQLPFSIAPTQNNNGDVAQAQLGGDINNNLPVNEQEGPAPVQPLFGLAPNDPPKPNTQPLFAMKPAEGKDITADKETGKADNNVPVQRLFGLPPNDAPKPLLGNASAKENEDRKTPLPPNELSQAAAPLQPSPSALFKPQGRGPEPSALSKPQAAVQARTSAVPLMSTTQPKVRQLTKFTFPKNTNMVLVVDDNPVNRKLIGKMLSYFNLEYQCAEHGKKAVEIMESSQNYTGDTSAPLFGMVIMDLCMPVMNGYEATQTIRSTLKLEVPIVTLTASAMEDEKRKALEAGATEFATKPLLRAALHKKCEAYLKPPGENPQGAAVE